MDPSSIIIACILSLSANQMYKEQDLCKDLTDMDIWFH